MEDPGGGRRLERDPGQDPTRPGQVLTGAQHVDRAGRATGARARSGRDQRPPAVVPHPSSHARIPVLPRVGLAGASAMRRRSAGRSDQQPGEVVLGHAGAASGVAQAILRGDDVEALPQGDARDRAGQRALLVQ